LREGIHNDFRNRWLTDKWWLSPYNWVDEVRQQFALPERVSIHDVTLREAMQSPRVCLRPEEKIRIARALDKLGVDSIENGAYMSELEKEVTKISVPLRHIDGRCDEKKTGGGNCSRRSLGLSVC
jgi:hypothetical protein